jgi:hypothetical protein
LRTQFAEPYLQSNKEVKTMQNQIAKKWNWKTLLPTAVVAGVTLLTPLLGTVEKAEAKRGHGRANGHSKQSNWRRSERRWNKGNNGVRRRTRTRRGWDRDDRWERGDNDGRSYRWRYRTRRDNDGNTYRQWFRQYL